MKYQIIQKYHDNGKGYFLAQYRDRLEWKYIYDNENLIFGLPSTPKQFSSKKAAIRALQERQQIEINRNRSSIVIAGDM